MPTHALMFTKPKGSNVKTVEDVDESRVHPINAVRRIES